MMTGCGWQIRQNRGSWQSFFRDLGIGGPLRPAGRAGIDRILPGEVKAKAKRFEYSENGGLLVITDQGWQARFGSPDDFEYKIAVLKAIIQNAKTRNAKFTAVDLRFGHRPFIR